MNKYLSAQDIAEYVQNKFYAYDQIKPVKDPKQQFESFREHLMAPRNIAIVEKEQKEDKLNQPGQGEAADYPVPIVNDSDLLTVERFNANTIVIRTNFLTRKFLVYNDSFHKDWKVFVNGTRTDLYRANFAFKGAWIPAGDAKVRFEFHPWGGTMLHWFMISLFFGFFAWTLGAFFTEIKRGAAL